MSNKSIKILLVEDNAGDARLIHEMFKRQRSRTIELTHVECMSDAEKHLAEHEYDIILLDLGLPDAQGLGAVRRSRVAAPHVLLVVLTGLDDESLAAQVLQEGAQDHLIKGQIETRGLLRALRYAIERKISEEAVFAEKERAQVTLNSIGDAVISTDTSDSITFLNLVADKMTGWPLQEAVGRPMAEVFRILEATGGETTPNPRAISAEKNCMAGSDTQLNAAIRCRKITATRTQLCRIVCRGLPPCPDAQTRKSPRDRKPAGCDRAPLEFPRVAARRLGWSPRGRCPANFRRDRSAAACRRSRPTLAGSPDPRPMRESPV